MCDPFHVARLSICRVTMFGLGRCGDALSKPSDYHHTFMDYKEWLDDSREFEERTGVWDESKVANFEVRTAQVVHRPSFSHQSQALTRDGFACLVIPEAYSDQYIRANPGRFTNGEYACCLESTRIIPQLSDCSFDGDACPSAEKVLSYFLSLYLGSYV